MRKFGLVLCVLMTIVGVGCWAEDTATKQQREATQQMTAEAHQAVGMPGISNWQEKRFVRMLYELRDQNVATFSYVQDFNGKLHFVCHSIGYGVPASVQFSNPMAWAVNPIRGNGYGQLPQAEPNGLFMPEGLSATYVMCAKGKSGEVDPIYVEQPVMVSPFPLVAVDSLQPGVAPPAS